MDTQQPKYFRCPGCGKYTQHVVSVSGQFKVYVHKTEKHEEPYPHTAIIESCQVGLRKA